MRFAWFAIVVTLAVLPLTTATAQPARSGWRDAAVELSAQARDNRIRRRPVPQLRVYPRELYPYPCRNFHAAFVLPYDFECPGANAVRHCSFTLEQEHRPSGTVVVPRQRCWWGPD